MIILAAMVSACGSLPQNEPEPVINAGTAPAVPAEVPPSKEIAAKPLVTPPDRPVAVLLSDNNIRHQHIVDALRQQSQHRMEVFTLPYSSSHQSDVINQVQASQATRVISIGSLASRQAKALEDKRVVFADVFNYQSEGLTASGFAGVSMIPSAEVLFSVWKRLSPGLSRVAIITGPGNNQQLEQLSASATKFNVDIIHRVVNSDKELVYASKQLSGSVQGLWLLPDNRVLSRRSMKELMSSSMKQGKQVVVFNRQLLKIGGLIHVSAEPEDISAQLLSQLEAEGSSVLPLRRAVVEINERTAGQLKLEGYK